MLSLDNLWRRAVRRARDEFFPPVHPFDQAKGVDTSGRLSLRRLGVASPNRSHGRSYQGVEPGRFSDAMKEIHADFSLYTFVDLGAGKGRALIMAHELHFGRLIGVEFSPQLAAIAEQNLTTLNVANARIIVQDAADFRFPTEALVVFTFNSFGPEILARVLRNLRSHPGPLYLVYLNALHDSTIRDERSLRPLVTGKFHSVWHREAADRGSDFSG
jgi:SAM-dependent methyltransferase